MSRFMNEGPDMDDNSQPLRLIQQPVIKNEPNKNFSDFMICQVL